MYLPLPYPVRWLTCLLFKRIRALSNYQRIPRYYRVSAETVRILLGLDIRGFWLRAYVFRVYELELVHTDDSNTHTLKFFATYAHSIYVHMIV